MRQKDRVGYGWPRDKKSFEISNHFSFLGCLGGLYGSRAEIKIFRLLGAILYIDRSSNFAYGMVLIIDANNTIDI